MAFPNMFVFFSLASLLPLASTDASPKRAIWRDTPIGPDGPWNAVEVNIGSSSNPVALFPGRKFQTYVITSDYCAYNSSISHCAAGTYNKDSAIEADLDGIQFAPAAQELMAGVEVKGNETKMFADKFDMGFEGGVIEDVSMSLLETQMLGYPGGDWYPLFTGCLSLGAQSFNQTFEQQFGDPINGSIIPWYLSDNDVIPSSSFGMHLGSAASKSSMDGSLTYGGYDRNRVIGNVLNFDGTFTESITLKDIEIRVIKGTSPFDFESKNELLAAGNNTISSGIDVVMDPCSPYLTLPKSTCDALAEILPIDHNSKLGLYIWDTSDPAYERIIRSASALSFVFEDGSNELTIHVPFQHLNLTLEPPLTDKPTPYFPCMARGSDIYVLGRAFFQDAFIGANWENERWWLAQAPGPSAQSDSDVKAILSDDTRIYSQSDDWEASWDDVWTGLSKQSEPKTNSDGKAGDQSNNENEEEERAGLSTGAMAGIGVGAAAVVVLAVVGAVILWRRKSKKGQNSGAPAPLPQAPHEGYYHDGQQKTFYTPSQGPVEVVGSSVVDSSATSEMAGDERYRASRYRQSSRYELP